jgi:GT2 family glycosyltransferase
LREAVESVKNQIYPHWELCIADDASTLPSVREVLDGYAAGDSRVKVRYRPENGHISEASNSALALAQGEFVALLDHDDVLSENALAEVALAIRNSPDASLFYSDEDKLDFHGKRCEPYFKSDWNPDLFLSHNLFTHLGVYRRDLLEGIGGFRAGFEGAQDYDLVLRCVEAVGHGAVRHIPKVLYHWRMTKESTAAGADKKPYAARAAVRAIGESLARRGIAAKVTEFMPGTGLMRVKYRLPDKPPKVSIIIPTRDRPDMVRRCVKSVFDRTTYPNYEIVLVDNGSREKKSLAYFSELARRPNVRKLRDDGPFNYSRLNNMAVGACGGEIVCLLNNDTEVITPEWLSEMVSHALRPDIGAVGARLWYPNDSLQHGGVVLGIGGVAGHVHLAIRRDYAGYFGRAWVIQNFSAVTGACLMVKKSIYQQVGGLNESDLPVSFNDIDFCIRVRDAGYRNLWTPFAELYHYESATRGSDTATAEKRKRFERESEYMIETHGEKLKRDPAYNPNLSLKAPFSLAFPPRG